VNARAWYAIAACAVMADALTTWAGTALGYSEGNPVVAKYSGGGGIAIVAAVRLVGLTAFFGCVSIPRYRKLGWTLIAVACITAVLPIWNVYVMTT
jgi:hypothetical protein